MASIGFAVGLGNIWRFPYVTGENGGSAFVVVYLICAFVIGVPILMAEVMVGRRGGLTPPGSMGFVAVESGRSPLWAGVGYLNLLAAFLVVIAYAVVAGWVLHYLSQAVVVGFAGLDAGSSSSKFDALLLNVPELLLWAVATLLLAGGILYGGVQKGIERAVVVLMPLLFALLVGLAVFNAFTGGMSEAIHYLFAPDFSKVNGAMMIGSGGS